MAAPIINKALTALRKFLLSLTANELAEILNGTKKIIVTGIDGKIKSKKCIVEENIPFETIKKYPLKKEFWQAITHRDDASTKQLRNTYILEKYGETMCDPKLFFQDVKLFQNYINQFEMFDLSLTIVLEMQ